MSLLRWLREHAQTETPDGSTPGPPPNLHTTHSLTENCHSCVFMGDHGRCKRYEVRDRVGWPVEPHEVCDTWKLDSTHVTEASYELHDGRSVWYDAGDALRDAADLYAMLEENYQTGSPNLENMQAKEILGLLQSGGGLGELHVGTLRRLLAKHGAQLAAFRRAAGDGQDMLDMASEGPDSRIIVNPDRS